MKDSQLIEMLIKDLEKIITNAIKKDYINDVVDPHFKSGNVQRYGWEPYDINTPSSVKDTPMLVDTGALRRSLKTIKVKINDDMTIEFINEQDYAKYHHNGVPNRLPKRSPITPSSKEVIKIEKSIQAELNRYIKRLNKKLGGK